MKMVIYKECGKFRCTPESNYNISPCNARRIQHLDDFESAEQIIQYYCKHFGSFPEDFIVEEG